jgi:ribosomal protein S18 acetylase RimI-like enzyme
MSIEFSTLEQRSLAEVSHAFNMAFSGYFMEATINEHELSRKIKMEDLRLDLSPACLKEGRIIGLMLNGLRVQDGCKILNNCGTAVVPDERGRGIAPEMFAQLLPTLRSESIAKCQLQVLDINHPAIRCYSKLGFKKNRFLESFEGRLDGKILQPDYLFCKLQINRSIRDLKSWWDFNPTWQNQTESILNSANDFDGIELQVNGESLAYGIWAKGSGRLIQIAVKPSHQRAGLGKTLMHAIQARIPHPLMALDVERNLDNPSTFFEQIGMRKIFGQWEMKLNLAQAPG